MPDLDPPGFTYQTWSRSSKRTLNTTPSVLLAMGYSGRSCGRNPSRGGLNSFACVPLAKICELTEWLLKNGTLSIDDLHDLVCVIARCLLLLVSGFLAGQMECIAHGAEVHALFPPVAGGGGSLHFG